MNWVFLVSIKLRTAGAILQILVLKYLWKSKKGLKGEKTWKKRKEFHFSIKKTVRNCLTFNECIFFCYYGYAIY